MTWLEGKAAIGQYIDDLYNLRRRHSALSYKSPLAFEAEIGPARIKSSPRFPGQSTVAVGCLKEGGAET